jgi:polysaccharide pyruvyl transferase WcaK-like protein
VADQLLSMLPSEKNVHVPRIQNVSDLLVELVETDLVIATRYHNLLLALLTERPSIAISYSNKCSALMEYAGLADLSQPIEQLDVARLKRQFQTLAGKPEPPLNTIIAAKERACASLATQYERTLEFLTATRGH